MHLIIAVVTSSSGSTALAANLSVSSRQAVMKMSVSHGCILPITERNVPMTMIWSLIKAALIPFCAPLRQLAIKPPLISE